MGDNKITESEAKIVVRSIKKLIDDLKRKKTEDFLTYEPPYNNRGDPININKIIEKGIDSVVNEFYYNTKEFQYYRTKEIPENCSDSKCLNIRYSIKSEVVIRVIENLKNNFEFKEGVSNKKRINQFLKYVKLNARGATLDFLQSNYNLKRNNNHDDDTNQERSKFYKKYKKIELKENIMEKNIYEYDNSYSNMKSAEGTYFDHKFQGIKFDLILEFTDSLKSPDKEIYNSYRINETKTQKQLAKEYGISQPAISKKVAKIDNELENYYKANNEYVNKSA